MIRYRRAIPEIACDTCLAPLGRVADDNTGAVIVLDTGAVVVERMGSDKFRILDTHNGLTQPKVTGPDFLHFCSPEHADAYRPPVDRRRVA